MFTPVHIPKPNFREELERIRVEISRIANDMPKKTAYQEELDRLRDTDLLNASIIKEQTVSINRLLSLNEQLLDYIGNLEEIKKSGGIVRSFKTAKLSDLLQEIKIKTITIPEVKIAVIED